ncbi:MAG: hypothetical protein ACYSOI_06660 [Planctomycetota bacterium]|jgi:hypothetical protein
MDPIRLGNWLTFFVICSIIIQNEYSIWTGKKKCDTREKKMFRYGFWIGAVGFLILALTAGCSG